VKIFLYLLSSDVCTFENLRKQFFEKTQFFPQKNETRIALPHFVGPARRQDRSLCCGRIREKKHPAANKVSDPAGAFGDDPCLPDSFEGKICGFAL
jgi:hypothetical protein